MLWHLPRRDLTILAVTTTDTPDIADLPAELATIVRERRSSATPTFVPFGEERDGRFQPRQPPRTSTAGLARAAEHMLTYFVGPLPRSSAATT
ncbi:MAG: hypothetical protein ACRDLS_00315 [Solirubrobacteraceae bacterium]